MTLSEIRGCAHSRRSSLLTPIQGKRVFIKDMLYYLVPPDQQSPKLAPSLKVLKRGIGTEKATNGVNDVNGASGAHDVHGDDGANGVHHVNGASGTNGDYHVNGTNGVHHVNGADGTNGDCHGNGTNGVHHVNGADGTNGGCHGNGTNGSGKAPPFPYPTKGEPANPTIVPRDILEKFHFTFLIRDPHSSIPSYYRCTIPPLEDMTGWHEFYPNEAGYDELRRFFDYARETGLVRDKNTSLKNGIGSGDAVKGHADVPEVCMIDADDLLDDPEGILRAYCKSIGLDFHPDMLNWDNDEDQERAKAAFEKWKGFHEDAIDSTDLKPRVHVSSISIWGL